MTNPDNVGGQAPLIPRLKCLASLLQQLNAQTACQAVNDAIAEIELCRAAPDGGDESCPLCGSNDCECADEQEDLKAYPCGKPPDSAPAGSGEVEEYDWDAAHEALESIDDYARMDVGVAPHGPYTVLRDLLTKAKGWQEAAALLRKLQQGADYVMVPRVPTEAMRAAFTAESMPGFAAMTTIRIGDFGERYRYMIAASQGQEGGTNGND